jgi:hypothetical protein
MWQLSTDYIEVGLIKRKTSAITNIISNILSLLDGKLTETMNDLAFLLQHRPSIKSLSLSTLSSQRLPLHNSIIYHINERFVIYSKKKDQNLFFVDID